MQTDSAGALIEQLQLAAHPEGGWYRETWRGQVDAPGRARGTAIQFLLKSNERSHWHRVDADELWLWQGGDPLDLMIADTDAGPVRTLTLGPAFGTDCHLQGLVPAGAWQAAEPASPGDLAAGFTLVSCIVVPGFDFAGFELAPPGWQPGKDATA
ncbi:cupin domain-containing protein [Erythrobacter sp. JK5]|uniref:cupin domain-containing protein n=1 Tax=Erythrobacter sp. JK5 TaxID=2829500 RepID=UPI001BABD869|nr:cupin domain-containing protein [Erythrobacter sp. JK5]QUL39275.1 cupin domain-containing protein [Erythrobacter sp. JK5]